MRDYVIIDNSEQDSDWLKLIDGGKYQQEDLEAGKAALEYYQSKKVSLKDLFWQVKRYYNHVGRPGKFGGSAKKGKLDMVAGDTLTKKGYNKFSSRAFWKGKDGKTAIIEEQDGRWKLSKSEYGKGLETVEGLDFNQAIKLSEDWLR